MARSDFPTPESRLALALDVTERARAEELVEATAGKVGVYKIGLEFAMCGGLDFAKALCEKGHTVFLDMKLLDIANTVAGAVRAAGTLGVRYLTVHAYPQALTAAVKARPAHLNIVAVTVLTSLDDQDLAEAGYQVGARTLVDRRIEKAAELGANSIVCSPHEAGRAHRSGLTVITPGVRLPDDESGDQKRISTPERAIALGADLLVVGRPITGAADPGAAADAYISSIAKGIASRRH